ncbi:SAM-dependent methyltransferase [Paenibacillus shirakamiensis]|uniref:SAM-dependent methyltransferase n=1 Tax=Paenibacillus shirakamiensis TaxID=1265935 RepID=A0ABS4JDV9_9BACL|nr:class I SAM-dependent methyltransferase [Paenibacillus shirakamiensis]MBP1999898.1 SAM-dependent methyltransferase [Paenibacillus shirakamiensis]
MLENIDLTDPYISRFFHQKDVYTLHLIYDLPEAWWSRPYEYEWCKNFISKYDCVLDAACGIPHPLKFYLANHSAEVFACDADPRIASAEQIYEEIRSDIGEEACKLIEQLDTSNLYLEQGNIAALSYADETFDKILCISVLEHMNLPDQLCAMQEFHRTLKKQGTLLITLDYPTVDLTHFINICLSSGFTFAKEPDCRVPIEALHTDLYGGLYCFRAVLLKIMNL